MGLNSKKHLAVTPEYMFCKNGQALAEYLLVFFVIFGIPLMLFWAATAYPQKVEIIAPYVLGFVAFLFVCSTFFVAGRKFWLKLRDFMQNGQNQGGGAKKYLLLLKELVLAILIVVSGSFLSIMFFVGSFLFVSFGFVSSAEFDQEVWKADQDKRYAMVESLVNDVGLKGRTRNEVHQMLGSPMPENQSSEVKSDECYSLGLAKVGLVPEVAWLYLWYKDDKVVKVSWSID
jgi:hypothetical protein